MNVIKFAVTLAALAVFCVSANASIVEFDYTGTISSGYDQTGVFGVAGTDLTGESFYASIILNTAPMSGQYIVDTPTQQAIFGGDDFGTPSPSLGATLTVDGRSVLFSGLAYGIIDAEDNDNYSVAFQRADDRNYTGPVFINNTFIAGVLSTPADLPAFLDNNYEYVPENPQS